MSAAKTNSRCQKCFDSSILMILQGWNPSRASAGSEGVTGPISIGQSELGQYINEDSS